MKEIYLIQDVRGKEYYFSWHTAVEFTEVIWNADHFISYDEAVKALQDDYNSELFKGKVLEIKKYFINEE